VRAIRPLGGPAWHESRSHGPRQWSVGENQSSSSLVKKLSTIQIATVFSGHVTVRLSTVHLVHDFAIRYDRWCGWILVAAGLGRRWSRVTVEEDRVVVVMSYGFRSAIDRSAIRSISVLKGRVMGWGAHGWRGRWLVNGSSQGIVVLAIDPPARARVLGVPVRVRELAVSLEDPVGFAATLGFELPNSPS
jgi:hypothetical protein